MITELEQSITKKGAMHMKGQMAFGGLAVALVAIAVVVFLFSQLKMGGVPTTGVTEEDLIAALKQTPGGGVLPLAEGSETKDSTEIAAGDDFYLSYDQSFDRWALVITNGPISEVQAKGEDAVLAKFDGDKQRVCSLDIRVVLTKQATHGMAEETSLQMCL